VQLAAAITADGDEVGGVEHALGEAPPARDDDLVDDVRAVGDERFYGLIAAKAFGELIVRGLQRVAERLDGSDVAT
jgi:hypothetical protein